jgi:hypothetical protein
MDFFGGFFGMDNLFCDREKLGNKEEEEQQQQQQALLNLFFSFSFSFVLLFELKHTQSSGSAWWYSIITPGVLEYARRFSDPYSPELSSTEPPFPPHYSCAYAASPAWTMPRPPAPPQEGWMDGWADELSTKTAG